MRALLTTVSLALMLGAIPAIAQTKPDSGKKTKHTATMPAKPATPPAATTPAATAPAASASAGSAPATTMAKKHRKPKVKKPAN